MNIKKIIQLGCFQNKSNSVIYINGRFLTQEITGVQRYAIEIIKTLDQYIMNHNSYEGAQFVVLTPQNMKMKLSLKKITLKKVGSFTGHLWEQIELPFYAGHCFLINLCNTASVLKSNQIVTIHDAAVYAKPQGFSLAFRSWYKILFFILGKRLKKIITDSEFSKEEIFHYCKIPKKNIVAIHLGVDHILRINSDHGIISKYDLKDERFVFAVSSMNPNKNFRVVLEVARINPKVLFIIAGGTNPKVFHFEKLEFPPNVKYVGFITDEELVGFYKHASCFLYPSLYEGFGLPPLEAMACGCPVIVSNKASLPEVCGDAAIYCDPYDVNDIAEKIRLIFDDEEIVRKLSMKGLKYVEKYRWDSTTKKILDACLQELNPIFSRRNL